MSINKIERILMQPGCTESYVVESMHVNFMTLDDDIGDLLEKPVCLGWNDSARRCGIGWLFSGF